MKRISLTILALLFCTFAHAECPRNIEEDVLICYFKALTEKDESAVLEIYYDIDSFNVSHGLSLKSFSVIEKDILKEDLTDLFKNTDIKELPLWARKGTIRMIVVQYFEDGIDEKHSYAVREIDGQLYMVGHTAFNAPI